MSKEVAKYPSKSKPGEYHYLVEGDNGELYCNCWPWKRNRTCKHIEDYVKKNSKEDNNGL